MRSPGPMGMLDICPESGIRVRVRPPEMRSDSTFTHGAGLAYRTRRQIATCPSDTPYLTTYDRNLRGVPEFNPNSLRCARTARSGSTSSDQKLLHFFSGGCSRAFTRTSFQLLLGRIQERAQRRSWLSGRSLEIESEDLTYSI